MTTPMSNARSVGGPSPDAARGFRRLLESTQIVQWEADAKTRDFTYVGSQAERLLGYPLNLWYEPDFWKTHLHEDDRQRVLLFREEALLEQEAYELEYRMIAADGHSVWAHDVVAVERVNDTPTVIPWRRLQQTRHTCACVCMWYCSSCQLLVSICGSMATAM